MSSTPLSRRTVLQLMAVAAAGVVLRPLRLARSVAATPAAGMAPLYLTSAEYEILEAAAEAILPSDGGTGAKEIGVADYIQSLLTFLPGSDANCDRFVNAADVTAVLAKAHGSSAGCPEGGDVNGDTTVDRGDVEAAAVAVFRARPAFAGGPFSGRNPQPHFPKGNTACSVCHGAGGGSASGRGAGLSKIDAYPPDHFRKFLPLTRLQALSWKVRLFGSEAIPEFVNPLVDELPEVDLRRRYQTGLAQLEASSPGGNFARLPVAQRQAILESADPVFVEILRRHVIQGTLCAPEYGGNRDRLGWQLLRFDGDSQPLGYEIYDPSVEGFYRERPDKPNSGPNPDEGQADFSDAMHVFLEAISGATGGGRFASPYRFEIDA